MARETDLRDKIIDTALVLAEKSSWEAVRLYDVAAALGLSLDDIRVHFREKDELVDAWFDRADGAMLKDAAAPDFQALPSRKRLQRAIMTWLGALAPHKKATREMIYGKLEPGHLHIQIPALMRVSRTVQWFREAAHRDATYLHRALEETGVTTMYLMTFFYWMQDSSENAIRTARFLDGLLDSAATVSHWVFNVPRSSDARSADSR